MASLFKKFVKGILYFLVLPVVLVVLSIYAVFGLFQFCIVGIKALFLFFSGRNIFGDFPEDIEARKKLYGDPEEDAANNVEVVNTPEDPYITSPFEEQNNLDQLNQQSLPPLPNEEVEEIENIEPVSFIEEQAPLDDDTPFEAVDENKEDKGGEL